MFRQGYTLSDLKNGSAKELVLYDGLDHSEQNLQGVIEAIAANTNIVKVFSLCFYSTTGAFRQRHTSLMHSWNILVYQRLNMQLKAQ